MEKKPTFQKNSKASLFLELARPDEESGFSRAVAVCEFTGPYANLEFNNGCSWGRADGALAKIYNVERIKNGKRVVTIQLHGYNKNPIQKNIPQNIRDAFAKKPQTCVVTCISHTEIDHKDGYRDEKSLQEKDYQPLSKAVNVAKRQHCKHCRQTNSRFDAKKLGYQVSQWIGEKKYKGSCTGCYWYDPLRFNHEVSANFTRKQQ